LHFKDEELEAALEKMMIDKGSGFSAFEHVVSTHYMNF
jgi:hypothetical protein